MSDNDRRRPDDDQNAPEDDANGPDEEDEGPDNDDEPVEGDDPSAPPLDRAVVERFLRSKEARDVAIAAIRKLVPKQEVEDLANDAVVRAFRATTWPSVEAALVGWLTSIARRRAIRWLEKRKRRQKYEGAMPTKGTREDAYTGAAIEDDDDGDAKGYDPEKDGEPEDLLGDHLDRLVGDNTKDLETLGWIREHAGGKAYKAIGAERGLTEDQIASRIRRFKLKYEKPIKRRRQRMLLLWLGGGAAAVVAAAVILWWLFFREAHSYLKPLPAPSANATATSASEGLPVSHPRPPDDDEETDASADAR
jgi:DNA-directed RNA polymerase specialized sigma24 family protein